MLNKTMILTILIVIFAFPSCVNNRRNTRSHSIRRVQGRSINTGNRPGWVDGNDTSEFPKSIYLIAVGYSKNRKSAEENARAEMSQIFNTKIKAVRNSRKHASLIKKDGKMKLLSMDFTSDAKIKNETESIFAGLKLSKYWKDSKGMIYVLATINKPNVLPPLKDKIEKFDNVIKKLVNEANNSTNKLVRISKLIKAVKKAKRRGYYNAQVAIISSNGETIYTKYDFENLMHMLSVQLDSLNISVSVSGNGNKIIKSAIIKALSDLGLKVQGEENNINNGDFENFNDFGEDSGIKKSVISSNTDLVIEGNVSFRSVDKQDNFKWIVGDITLTIKDNKTGKLINSISIHKKIKRPTLEDARRIAGIKIAKKLVLNLKKEFIKKMTANN